MDTSVAKEMISVIRAEQQRRARRADELENEVPDYATDQWLFADVPFVNELCLILLVAVWHQVERELIWLAARVTGDGKEINREQYQQNVKRERELFRNRAGREKTIEKLKLNNFAEWKSSMKTLRLLANCYKHHPSLGPDEELLKHLKLDATPNYIPLPESRGFREGLAANVSLPKDADYCDIAEKLLNCVDGFLTDLQKQTVLSRVTGAVSLTDFGC